MEFYFNAYSTPLLFGFVQAWVYAALLWWRGRREERLADVLLGWVLVGLAFNIWEYMLGFGGIEILWREGEFLPRTLGYLFPVLCYFYLRAQFDATFRLTPKDLWHVLPFAVYVTYHVLVWAQGPDFVRWWEPNVHERYGIGTVEFWLGEAIDVFYFYLSLRLYRQYRAWIKTQFSETDSISLRWFRNFLVALLAASLFSLFMTILSAKLSLTFWQDWWDELAGVALIYYVAIHGYAQAQLRHVALPQDSPLPPDNVAPAPSAPDNVAPAPLTPDETALQTRLLAYMDAEKPYLDPELSLADLARRLHVAAPLLSRVVNAGVGRNFNDFVNLYRVEEFKQQVRDPANGHLSLLGVALNCGFNSKATFNRAFRKFTGQAPGEWTSL